MLELDAVLFNDDPLSPANGLNLRRNATQMFPLPEWRRTGNGDADESEVAYAVNVARQVAPTVRAQLRRVGPLGPSAQVRAVDAGDGNVLGSLQARTVAFLPDGTSRFEPFALEGTRLRQAGVGVHTVTWRWQFRPDRYQPWSDFATSSHRIYSVLSVPQPPWQQAPYTAANTQLPWTEVLDHACSWAAGARTLDEAATMITRAVFDLGSDLVEYGCQVDGISQYSLPYFNCSAFLELLDGRIGRGRFVNCQDCATVVATFANILGCRLWQSGMGLGFFALNPIVAIGSSGWRTACGWAGFTYHEVAWKGQCGAQDSVFDACLLIDADADPTRAPHSPMLATDLRFGNPGEGAYRDRLAAPAGRISCQPLPWTRQRRPLF